MRSLRSDDAAKLARLIALPFAHRGLHGAGRIENSRAAITAAIERGHGIELDVQASADGDAFVIHDDELDRLADGSGPLAARRSADLVRIRLAGSDETVPKLTEILELIAGRVPLLIEVKARERAVDDLCRSVADAMSEYDGVAAVMSFNPLVGRWFADHAPDVLRGLVVTEREKRGWRGRTQRRLALWRARPHLLAYDIRDLPSRFAAAARAMGIPIVTWTVRTAEERARAALHADQIIYENAR